jgi:hypothetical protein
LRPWPRGRVARAACAAATNRPQRWTPVGPRRRPSEAASPMLPPRCRPSEAASPMLPLPPQLPLRRQSRGCSGLAMQTCQRARVTRGAPGRQRRGRGASLPATRGTPGRQRRGRGASLPERGRPLYARSPARARSLVHSEPPSPPPPPRRSRRARGAGRSSRMRCGTGTCGRGWRGR